MTERPFPWSREVWAILLDKLFAAGARLVVFDMLLIRPNDGDPAFAAALAKYKDRVVVRSQCRYGQMLPQFVVPNSTLIPPPPAPTRAWAAFTFWKIRSMGKSRGALHHFRPTDRWAKCLAGGRRVYVSFAGRGLEQLRHDGDGAA